SVGSSAVVRRAPEARLPVGQRERGADDVADLLGVVDVVGEVPGVPEHHVGAVDRLVVDEAIDMGTRLGWIGGEGLAVVYLTGPAPERPQVAHAEGVAVAVVRAGRQRAALAGRPVD